MSKLCLGAGFGSHCWRDACENFLEEASMIDSVNSLDRLFTENLGVVIILAASAFSCLCFYSAFFSISTSMSLSFLMLAFAFIFLKMDLMTLAFSLAELFLLTVTV